MKSLIKMLAVVALSGILAFVVFKRVTEHYSRSGRRIRHAGLPSKSADKLPSISNELITYEAGETANPAELIVGKWEGYSIGTGSTANHEIEVKQVGDELKGYGFISRGLTRQQIADAKNGDFHLVKPLYQLATLVEQEYDVSLENDQLTFKGINAEYIYTNNFRIFSLPYSPDTYSAKFFQPGIFFGASTDEANSEGIFYLAKQETLELSHPFAKKKGATYFITCLCDYRYHYQCYVPKSYDPAKPAPVLINDSPGRNAPPLSPKMAEELGWIMVGLTESANGISVRICNENCAAVLMDLRCRFNIDMDRVYFSGMSGGARRTTQRGIYHAPNCAGLICIAAGFSWFSGGTLNGQRLYPPIEQPIFFIVGKTDMNHREIVDRAYPREARRKRNVELIVHPGGHTWGRKKDHEAAIQWLDEQWGK